MHFGNFGTPNEGIVGQNDIWVQGPWLGIKNIIKAKVVSPNSGLWWILWICVCLWFVRSPRVLHYALINLLFGLCKSMWINDMLVICINPIPKLQHAPLPPKCCESRSIPQLLVLPLFSPWIHNRVYQGAWMCVNVHFLNWMIKCYWLME